MSLMKSSGPSVSISAGAVTAVTFQLSAVLGTTTPLHFIEYKNEAGQTAFCNTGKTAAEAAAVYPTAQSDPTLLTKQNGKHVLSTHDLVYEKNPEYDWCSIILASGSGNVHVTAGNGP